MIVYILQGYKVELWPVANPGLLQVNQSDAWIAPCNRRCASNLRWCITNNISVSVRLCPQQSCARWYYYQGLRIMVKSCAGDWGTINIGTKMNSDSYWMLDGGWDKDRERFVSCRCALVRGIQRCHGLHAKGNYQKNDRFRFYSKGLWSWGTLLSLSLFSGCTVDCSGLSVPCRQSVGRAHCMCRPTDCWLQRCAMDRWRFGWRYVGIPKSLHLEGCRPMYVDWRQMNPGCLCLNDTDGIVWWEVILAGDKQSVSELERKRSKRVVKSYLPILLFTSNYNYNSNTSRIPIT